MNLVPISFDGVAVNDGTNYKGYFPFENSLSVMAGSEVVEVQRAFLPPDYAVKNLKSKTVPLAVVMLGAAATQIDALKKLFNTRDQTPRNLIVGDMNDLVGGLPRQWQLSATCVSHTMIDGAEVVFGLYIEDDCLYSVTAQTDTWTISSAATATHALPATLGNANAQPVITITPTAGTNGWLYKKFLTVLNNSDTPVTNYPFNVMGTLFDTASLVTAGKMRSDGNDVRVMVDGNQAPIWLGTMNTTATKAWVNLNLSKRNELVLSANVAGSGLGNLYFDANNYANITKLGLIRSGMMFLVDSEIIEVGTPNLTTCTLPMKTRGLKGTTAASHIATTTIKWIEHDIWLTYGNSAAAAQVVDDAYKPMFNVTSTNSQWTYTNFLSASQPNRPGSFVKMTQTTNTGMSGLYTAPAGTSAVKVNADPATALGMWYENISGKVERTGELRWGVPNPFRASLVCSGYKYSNKIGSGVTPAWPVSVGAMPAASPWLPPTAVSTVQSWSGTYSFDLANFSMQGFIRRTDVCRCYLEITAVYVTLSASVPSVAVGTEQSNYAIGCKITNNTTGEYITLTYALTIGQSVVIDCANRTCTLFSGSLLGSLSFSTVRTQWLDLKPGVVNTLQFDQANATSLTVVTTWQDRSL